MKIVRKIWRHCHENQTNWVLISLLFTPNNIDEITYKHLLYCIQVFYSLKITLEGLCYIYLYQLMFRYFFLHRPLKLSGQVLKKP